MEDDTFMKLKPTNVRSESQMLADDKVDPFFQMMESGMTIDEICKNMGWESFPNKGDN
jgi:hypothetical protein